MNVTDRNMGFQPHFSEETIKISKGNQEYLLTIRNVKKLKSEDVENIKMLLVANGLFPNSGEITFKSNSNEKVFHEMVKAISNESKPKEIETIEFVLKKTFNIEKQAKMKPSSSIQQKVNYFDEKLPILGNQVKKESRSASDVDIPTYHQKLKPPPSFKLPPKPAKSASAPSSPKHKTKPPPLPTSSSAPVSPQPKIKRMPPPLSSFTSLSNPQQKSPPPLPKSPPQSMPRSKTK